MHTLKECRKHGIASRFRWQLFENLGQGSTSQKPFSTSLGHPEGEVWLHSADIMSALSGMLSFLAIGRLASCTAVRIQGKERQLGDERIQFEILQTSINRRMAYQILHLRPRRRWPKTCSPSTAIDLHSATRDNPIEVSRRLRCVSV